MEGYETFLLEGLFGTASELIKPPDIVLDVGLSILHLPKSKLPLLQIFLVIKAYHADSFQYF